VVCILQYLCATYNNRDELQPKGPFGSYADSMYLPTFFEKEGIANATIIVEGKCEGVLAFSGETTHLTGRVWHPPP